MFEEVFPQYLVMGMSYEQFWEGPPSLTIAYRKAYRLKRETENEQAWLQGIYIYDAFAVCLANIFAKRGAKKKNYIEKPFDIFPLTKAQKKQREKEEVAKMQRDLEELIRRQKARKNKKGD